MVDAHRVLILGGTAEAMALAHLLHSQGSFQVTTSLAGVTSAPRRPKGCVRTGGFGGSEGLVRYLCDQGIEAMVDATHPFAAQMSRQAVIAAGRLDLPFRRLTRPAWSPQPADRWIGVADIEAAAAWLPRIGQRAFLTIGRKGLAAFARCADTWFLVRMVDSPTAGVPLQNAQLVLARGPFRQADEAALMRQHKIDVVIAKNSGGSATFGKIGAARQLGLPVIMIARPVLPAALEVSSVADAAAWLTQTNSKQGTRPF